jgi:hypothetical protein
VIGGLVTRFEVRGSTSRFEVRGSRFEKTLGLLAATLVACTPASGRRVASADRDYHVTTLAPALEPRTSNLEPPMSSFALTRPILSGMEL